MNSLTLALAISSVLSVPPWVKKTDFKNFDTVERFSAPKAISTFPSALAQQNLVNSLISQIQVDKVKAHLTKLASFPERYYKSQNGVDAATWLSNEVTSLAATASPKVKLTVKYFKHTQWKQPSVIARLEPVTSTGPGDIVITGTHFDTASYNKGGGSGDISRPNPAADDCASGSSVISETLRILVSQSFVPKRPIEFHWYAAEEEGLLGSDEVANDYAKRQVPVFTYLNLDQSGYVQPGATPGIGIITDYTTSAATKFLTQTVKSYTTVTRTGTFQCGYECTDNAAWYDAGYNSALAFESPTDAEAFPYNDQVNNDGTPLDTLDKIDFNHVTQFVRNTIGFLVELSLAP
ncbi:Leucine aminopeptidase 1 [Boothiomyces sp. JEL0866]|nr:Leucine aminopeptidase 1 [Boothiomyces sp. JEL0866]